MLEFHVIQNVGIDIGIIPVAGITLPFISYGGSALLTKMISIGLVMNAGMSKKRISGY
jgi:Bacterial cell division membrane protein